MLGELVIAMDDWLKNAGILGLYRILTEAEYERKLTVDKNSFSFSEELLENFSEKYFHYFNRHYRKVFTLFSMIDYGTEIKSFEKKGIEKLSKKDLEQLNAKIKYFKDKLKSNSYKSAFALVGGDFNPGEREKELKEIKIKDQEKLSDRLEDIIKQITLLKDTISVLESEKAQKYIGASNAMYNILNKAIGKVSFLNPQVKEKNMYKEFTSYFVDPVFDYLRSDKRNYKYRCFSCNGAMDSLTIGFSLMNHIGFDINRKGSNVWNFNNDVSICPVCRLIYACVPAGFTYLGNKGIFINYNHSIFGMQSINDAVRDKIYSDDHIQNSVFAGLVKGIQEEFYENIKYELQDLQVVRFLDNRYTFNVMTKVLLAVITKNNNTFAFIRTARWKEGSDFYSVYEEVMEALFHGQNLFLLIYKLIRYKLSGKADCFFTLDNVYTVVFINRIFLKEVGALDKNEKTSELERARGFGRNLQNEYGGFDASGKYNKKLNSIAYRMLNSLKTGNIGAFMDSMINAYMYVAKPIPNLFSKYLNNELHFKNLGYAFITGMLGEKRKEGKEHKNNDSVDRN